MDPRGGIEDDPPSSLLGSRIITIAREIKGRKEENPKKMKGKRSYTS
jgi:hypothetical protein